MKIDLTKMGTEAVVIQYLNADINIKMPHMFGQTGSAVSGGKDLSRRNRVAVIRRVKNGIKFATSHTPRYHAIGIRKPPEGSFGKHEQESFMKR